MQTYEPAMGQSIDAACREAVALAAKNETEVRFTFNDVALSAMPTDRPQIIEQRWRSIFEAKQEAYRNSPEGKAAAAEREQQRKNMQATTNTLIKQLPDTLKRGLDDLMFWLRKFSSTADHVGVTWDIAYVKKTLEDAGYIANEHAGQAPEWFNTRERMGRYVAGQAIECMNNGLPPLPVTASFVEEYFHLPK